MSKITGNEPAKPTIKSINHIGVIEIVTDDVGLTIRQEFAARAMQGILSSKEGSYQEVKDVIHDAILMADALIEELNKEV